MSVFCHVHYECLLSSVSYLAAEHFYRHPNTPDPKMMDCPTNFQAPTHVQYAEMIRSMADLFLFLSMARQYFYSLKQIKFKLDDDVEE